MVDRVKEKMRDYKVMVDGEEKSSIESNDFKIALPGDIDAYLRKQWITVNQFACFLKNLMLG